jgi:hypothetical protein
MVEINGRLSGSKQARTPLQVTARESVLRNREDSKQPALSPVYILHVNAMPDRYG